MLRRITTGLAAAAMLAGIGLASAGTASASPLVWGDTGRNYISSATCEYSGQLGLANGSWGAYDCREMHTSANGTSWELWAFL